MKKSFLIVSVLCFLLLTVFSLTVFSQPPPPGGPEDFDPSVPFDGGILCVILGALGLGIKKLITGIKS